MTKSRISIWVAAAVLLAGCSTGTPDPNPSPSPSASDQIARQFQTWMVGLSQRKHEDICNTWSYASDLLLDELVQGGVVFNKPPLETLEVDVQIPPGTPVTTAKDAFTDVLERECY
jgi:hypothetical protein